MYNQVIFYNAFGAGDVFESREFVKAWMNLVPSNSYHYAHGKNPRILLDIPELQFKEFTHHMDSMKSCWDDNNGNLYVNTWIGRDGKYVLPGIGCTVEKLYQMHNDMLKIYKLGELPGQPVDYIPTIEYYTYNLLSVIDFLYEHNEQDKIYIDNGVVQSNQAENFPFDNVIYTVANNHKDKCFIVTHSTKPADNIFFTNDITKVSGFDLNEISYLSKFCKVLIGRNSGPHVFTQVTDNVMNPEQKLLSFTYHQQGSSFVVNTDVKIQKFWSPATKEKEVIEEIERIIG